MKEPELRELAQCLVCGEKIGQKPLPIFHKVECQRFIVDMQVAQQQQGLAMMLGGEGLLAYHMGPDQDMANPVTAKVKFMVCDPCFLEKLPYQFFIEYENVDNDDSDNT